MRMMLGLLLGWAWPPTQVGVVGGGEYISPTQRSQFFEGAPGFSTRSAGPVLGLGIRPPGADRRFHPELTVGMVVDLAAPVPFARVGVRVSRSRFSLVPELGGQRRMYHGYSGICEVELCVDLAWSVSTGAMAFYSWQLGFGGADLGIGGRYYYGLGGGSGWACGAQLRLWIPVPSGHLEPGSL